METWVEDIFRGFFAMLDTVVFWFVELLVTLFDSLAKLRLFNNEVMGPLADRLFAMLSIAMIFKVSFSIIQFIINPSSFSDAEKGLGKIVQNVILVLVCLVGVKHIFNLAYNLQTDIITSNIIPQLVLGKGDAEGNYITAEQQEKYKRQIPFIVASVFVTPNTAIDGIEYDVNSGYYVVDDNGNKTDLYSSGDGTSVFGEKLDNISLQHDYYFVAEGTSKPRYYGAGTAFAQAHSTNDYALLFKITSAKHANKSEVYLFDYKFLISTAAGVFLVIMYVNFCIDLAIRVVKLGFLQLISPIPIVSMIDPKSSKSGIMSKWVNNYISTYLGLFIRVAAVNFVIFTLDAIVNNSEIRGHALFDFITVVTIFGALMFAREVPKLISDLTGVDLKGDFKLNPLKRVPVAEKALGMATAGVTAGVVGAAGGIAANTLATASNWKQSTGRERLSSLAGILTGGVSAGVRGMTSKEKNPFKAAVAGIQGSVAARNLRDARREAGNGGFSGFMNRRANDISNWAGVESGISRFDKEIGAYDDFNQVADSLDSYVEKEIIKNKGAAYENQEIANLAMDVSIKKNKIETLKNMSTQGMGDTELEAHAKRISEAETAYFLSLKKAKEKFIESKADSDDTVNSSIRQMYRLVNDNKSYRGFEQVDFSSGKSILDANKLVSNYSKTVKASDEYVQAKVNKRDNGK